MQLEILLAKNNGGWNPLEGHNGKGRLLPDDPVTADIAQLRETTAQLLALQKGS